MKFATCRGREKSFAFNGAKRKFNQPTWPTTFHHCCIYLFLYYFPIFLTFNTKINTKERENGNLINYLPSFLYLLIAYSYIIFLYSLFLIRKFERERIKRERERERGTWKVGRSEDKKWRSRRVVIIVGKTGLKRPRESYQIVPRYPAQLYHKTRRRGWGIFFKERESN